MDHTHNSGRTGAAGFSAGSHLIDNHGRPITYLRLAITDRCNLRCRYCMPEEGVPALPHTETLSYEELERLVRLFLSLGVSKVRITGGEPFARRGCLDFLSRLKKDIGVKHLYLTTNGVETAGYLHDLQRLGISGINLSLDTLDAVRFKKITRRDRLDRVLSTLRLSIDLGLNLKVNTVVLSDTGDEEILRLGELARSHPISLRFIEQMPFSGKIGSLAGLNQSLEERLERLFPGLKECPTDQISTARLFSCPGFRGTLAVIEGHSRKFCSTCNKIRITPQGMLKACLYDNGVLDLKKMIRDGAGDKELETAVRRCLARRHADGRETESVNMRENEPSMASIGG